MTTKWDRVPDTGLSRSTVFALYMTNQLTHEEYVMWRLRHEEGVPMATFARQIRWVTGLGHDATHEELAEAYDEWAKADPHNSTS